MNKRDIEVLKKVQKEPITFTDILGEHKGIIRTLSITEGVIYAYAIFFGQSCELRLNEVYMKWERVTKVDVKDGE